MKKTGFVFNLVNRIPFKEENENFISLFDREEADKIGKLEYFMKKHGYRYNKVFLRDNIPTSKKISEELREYINSMGLKENDFEDGIPTSVETYMKEKKVKEPDFGDDILNRLESIECIDANKDVKTNRQTRINYFFDLRMQMEESVLPAIKAIKDESIYEDYDPIVELEDWLKKKLNVLVFDLENQFVKLKKSPLFKDYPKKVFNFEEKIALELVQFSMKHGLAKVGVCENCGRYFLWANKSTKHCSDSCKSRKSEANRDKKKEKKK
jgi:hypothetical protein